MLGIFYRRQLPAAVQRDQDTGELCIEAGYVVLTNFTKWTRNNNTYLSQKPESERLQTEGCRKSCNAIMEMQGKNFSLNFAERRVFFVQVHFGTFNGVLNGRFSKAAVYVRGYSSMANI
jgi:hypothetical protein